MSRTSVSSAEIVLHYEGMEKEQKNSSRECYEILRGGKKKPEKRLNV